MMDFNERVIPGVTANFLYQEALARYEFASKLVKDGFKVLDVGCGTGYGDYFIANNIKCNVVGVDINKEAIAFANHKYKNHNIKFLVSDALKIPFRNDEIDIVLSFEVIEHIKKYPIFLREIKRVLKDNGKFILSTPNKLKTDSKNKSPYHIKEFNYQELKAELNKYFNKVEILGQKKSPKAKSAFIEFMKSQKARQTVVNVDLFKIRKLLPRGLKEFIWKYLGAFFGRSQQEELKSNDFQITNKNVKEAEYFIVVCQK